MVIVFAASQLKSIYSTYVKKDEIPDDNVVDRSYIGKRLIKAVKCESKGDKFFFATTILFYYSFPPFFSLYFSIRD